MQQGGVIIIKERRGHKQFHNSHNVGVILASISGILFTANNFVINRTQVDVGDVVLVRTAVQIAVYVTILVARGESFLPSSTEQKLYTVLQGKGIDLDVKCDILNVKRSDGLSMFHL